MKKKPWDDSHPLVNVYLKLPKPVSKWIKDYAKAMRVSRQVVLRTIIYQAMVDKRK